MIIRQEKNLKLRGLRAALISRDWELFKFYSIEPIDLDFDKNFSILAFEGAISKFGINTGFACFEISGVELGSNFCPNTKYYVQVA